MAVVEGRLLWTSAWSLCLWLQFANCTSNTSKVATKYGANQQSFQCLCVQRAAWPGQWACGGSMAVAVERLEQSQRKAEQNDSNFHHSKSHEWKFWNTLSAQSVMGNWCRWKLSSVGTRQLAYWLSWTVMTLVSVSHVELNVFFFSGFSFFMGVCVLL